MNFRFRLTLLIAFSVAVTLGAILAAVRSADATNQAVYGGAGAQNFTRACGFDGKKAQPVGVTGGTVSTTATPVGDAMVRIVCTSNMHFFEGLSGVTGPTAGTGDTYLPSNVPITVIAHVNTYFAFIQDSGGGTCYVTECN